MGRTAGAVLLLAAAAVMVMQVEVGAAPTRSCGSAWEVVAGRAGWQEWLAADVGGAAGDGSATTLTRTRRCPDAVNQRMVVAATLAVAAVAVAAVGELVARRRGAVSAPSTGSAGSIRRFGVATMVIGIVLTVSGLAGLALLVADPDDALFLYVSRAVVVLAGLLLVLPAILLVALGRAATLAADHLQRRRPDP